MIPILYGIRCYLIITVVTPAFVGYRLIFMLFYFGVTGGIIVGVTIIIHACFAFIKALIYHY